MLTSGIFRNSIAPTILPVLRSSIASHPGFKLVVTGHSLGGALASIASTSLANPFPPSVFYATYTFGQFRTDDAAYVQYVDGLFPALLKSGSLGRKMYRVTHTDDGVPQTIHRQAGGYAHHATEFWELEPFGAGKTLQCQGDDPTVCLLALACYQRQLTSDKDCNNSTLGLGIGGVGTAEGINPAHLCYSGILIGNPVDAGASACNAVSILPQKCSTGTLGGVV